MKSDFQLRRDVVDELTFDPSVTAENVAVSAKDGVVTLSGIVPTFANKYAAEKAAFRVAGVKAIAEEIEVKLPGSSIRTDQEIAKAASDALTWNVAVPSTVKSAVEDGIIILRGEVDWQYQRDSATKAVRWLTGVKEVKNRMSIRQTVDAKDVKQIIEDALVRTAEKDAKKISVSTVDGNVVLSGEVRSRAELEDAKWAAWAAPGVRTVQTNLSIGP